MKKQDYSHHAVLLEEAVAGLNIEPSGVYVDGTFGRGGHSKAILSHLNEQGKLIAFDKDPEAIAVAKEILADESRFSIYHASFVELEKRIAELGLSGKINGILLDLGVSSPQLDDSSRGFSFQESGPLDMRMNNQQGLSAAQWLGHAKETEIATVLKEYGEERYAKRIARAIVRARSEQPLTDTLQLAEIIKQAHPRWEKNRNPATRSFQGIRIYINNELGDLSDCLQQSVNSLAKHGRLAVISFHSLEDRIVKRFFRLMAEGEKLPPDLPVMDMAIDRTVRLIGKPVYVSDSERAQNPRSRSAVLRVAEKLK